MTLGPPQQWGVPNAHDNFDFLAVIGSEPDLEERRWSKRTANLEKNAKMII